ncbi:MAG: thiamine pyrophosphate-binding protein, partial [Candidatus Binatia bacterium]
MRTIDLIVEILKLEGVEFLSCYPMSPLIEAAAVAGIRPIICRQERTGVHIADGYTRLCNGKRIGVFTMQFGPGAENAFPGVATAFSDSVPILILPMGHPRERLQVSPFFRSLRAYASVTKWVAELSLAQQVTDIMRRAFSLLKMGRPGPVMIEIPMDVATEEVIDAARYDRPVKSTRTAGDSQDIAEAARALLQARSPVIHAGQGVLYAEAWDELVELAELLQAPVMSSLEGKSAFPENHPLSLGTGAVTMTRPVYHFLRQADVVFGIGCSFTRYVMYPNIPPGKVIIQATNN